MVCGDPDGVEFAELLNSPERPAEQWAGPQRHQVLQRDSLQWADVNTSVAGEVKQEVR
jgi:hypothetical protein